MRAQGSRARRFAVLVATGALLVGAVAGCGESSSSSGESGDKADAQEAPQSRAEALTYIEEAEASIAEYLPSTARSLLAEVDPNLIAADPGLAHRIARARELAGLTDRYVAATELADSGSYLAARQKMLNLAPFRDATAMAGGYATLAARDLVSQARDAYKSRPGLALGLLDRAEKVAPNLVAISTVRSLATSRQQALAAPPPTIAPTPAPTPAAPSCDPNYTGACIPLVSYDLNCGDVAATDFSSVGSDPHGFDREGDGLACES